MPGVLSGEIFFRLKVRPLSKAGARGHRACLETPQKPMVLEGCFPYLTDPVSHEGHAYQMPIPEAVTTRNALPVSPSPLRWPVGAWQGGELHDLIGPDLTNYLLSAHQRGKVVRCCE
jgi:hypothetical protein